MQMGSQAGVSNRQPHAQPHPPAERFQAQTFTDVLANVANDWKPEEGPSIWGGGNWGGSFATPGDSYAAPGEWGGSFPLPQAQALEPDRSFGHLPESSSNNGNLHAMQVIHTHQIPPHPTHHYLSVIPPGIHSVNVIPFPVLFECCSKNAPALCIDMRTTVLS